MMEEERKINHVFLCYTDGYPQKFCAANTKLDFLGKGLLELEGEVHTINKLYGANNVAPRLGENNGITFHSIVYKGNKLFASIINTYKVACLLKKIFSKDKKNVLYIGCGNVFVFIPLLWYSKLIGYNSAFILEEWEPCLDFHGLYKLNAYIHGFYFGYLFDYILPISEYLSEKAKKFNKPMMKLPICADFNSKMIAESYTSSKYFLYCANVGYRRALDFVVESFRKAFTGKTDVQLHLVLSGNENKIDDFKNNIDISLKQQIIVLVHLPYRVLLNEYMNAQGLLIPLFEDCITDIARFSQKISEYLTSKRPILSTSVGEVKNYFEDGKTMYISKSGDINGLSDNMKRILSFPHEASRIGESGYNFGKATFDYRILSKNLVEFFS